MEGSHSEPLIIASPSTRRTLLTDVESSCRTQWSVLLRHKELPLKSARSCVTFWEFVLPALLCATLWLSASASTLREAPAAQYAPQSLDEALGSFGPLGFATSIGAFLSPEEALQHSGAFGAADCKSALPEARLPSFLPASTAELLCNYTVDTRTPTGILPLPLFLTYSYVLSMQGKGANAGRFPPFDGSIIAVTPDTPSVRAFVEAVLTRSVDAWMLSVDGVLGRQIDAFVRACNVSLPGEGSAEALAAYLRSQVNGV